jgi:hypothetical protein
MFSGAFSVSFLIVANGGELIGTLDFFCFHEVRQFWGLTGFLAGGANRHLSG